jgi:hypothetical protein
MVVGKKTLNITTEAALVEAIERYSREVARIAVAAGSDNVEDYREELFEHIGVFYRALREVILNGNKARMSLRQYSWRQ